MSEWEMGHLQVALGSLRTDAKFFPGRQTSLGLGPQTLQSSESKAQAGGCAQQLGEALFSFPIRHLEWNRLGAVSLKDPQLWSVTRMQIYCRAHSRQEGPSC